MARPTGLDSSRSSTDTCWCCGFCPWVEPRLFVRLSRIEEARPPEIAQLHLPRYDGEHWRPLMQVMMRGRYRFGDLSEDELRAIRMPSLLVQGDRDPYVPLEVGVRTRTLIEGAQLCVVPDAVHAAQRRAPEIVGAFVRRFPASTVALSGLEHGGSR